MNDLLGLARKDPAALAAAIVAVVGLATIGGFFFFQYVLGYPPCPLCLDQRMAYYAACRWRPCSGSAPAMAPRARSCFWAFW